MTETETEGRTTNGVPEYLAAVTKARAEHVADRVRVREQFPQVKYATWDLEGADRARRREGSRQLNLAEDRLLDAEREARRALAASPDPLVAWLASDSGLLSGDYCNWAEALLAALPMTMAELDNYAVDQDWCSHYLRHRANAQDAGVLPGLSPMTAEHRAMYEAIVADTCDEDDELPTEELLEMVNRLESLFAAERAMQDAAKPSDLRDLFTRRWRCGVSGSGYHNGCTCNPGDPHDGWGCGYYWVAPKLTHKVAVQLGLTTDEAEGLLS